ncbi:MFS transporter [Benzoatithermus flavus]|uniref:MFS transporter n=1 Tax=Benzoatithermus flavus TaxID=3108223 RepID=A0ABU8XT22_9PROT
MSLLLPPGAGREARLLLLARGLRAAADGWISIVLPSYLLALGLGALEIGILATTTMLGSSVLTLAVGFMAGRLDPRRTLLAASLLMAATGLAFALAGGFWPLLVVAFVGTLNPSSGDVSLFLPLEQSLLAHSTAERDRTALFARYSLVGSLCGASGTLVAVLPETGERLGIPLLAGLRAMFVLYGFVGVAAWLAYRGLPRGSDGTDGRPAAPLGPSRRIVHRLAALFSLDSFAGGLVVQSLLALWLFDAFGLSLAAAAKLFFWTGVLSAASYLAAPPLARRIGLIRTMVFTHLPANVCLALVPFTSALWQAVALLLVRSLLSQMDVPARTSYVMAVVTPPERPAAASLTNVPRSLAAALSPTLAGWLLGLSGFGWPLLLAGLLKITYDLALLARFRHVRPPEERAG